jgi:hypothetical protein
MKRVSLVEFLKAPREALRKAPFELIDSTGVLAVVLVPRTKNGDRRQERGRKFLLTGMEDEQIDVKGNGAECGQES